MGICAEAVGEPRHDVCDRVQVHRRLRGEVGPPDTTECHPDDRPARATVGAHVSTCLPGAWSCPDPGATRTVRCLQTSSQMAQQILT